LPVYNPKRFVNPEALRRITPEALVRLLKPHKVFCERRGLRLPSLKEAANIDLDRLAEILATPTVDTPADLADALYFTNAMATPEGMHALSTYSRMTSPCSNLGAPRPNLET
jgi:hypothetical protein